MSFAQAVRAEGTDNHVLHAVPVPGKVTIDGSLDDWDCSGRVPICSDVTRLWGQYSAWVAMMYDAEALYVGVDWCDPTPMVNNYDPDFDIDRRKCFHSDSLQLHFRTDQARKVIGWWYTKGQRPGVIALNGWFPWNDTPIVYLDGIKELGITEAFQKKPDGKGYTQELRIPWKAIVKSGRAYQAGESFDCMLDLVWGPDSGKGWPVNHMMDLVQPDAVHTGWFWEVREIYGKVTLEPAGKLQLPPPEFLKSAAKAPSRLAGTLPVRLQLPKGDCSFFALAINDEAGRRVRALPGDCRVKDYQVGDDARKVEVLWDCLDDHGKLVPPGKYRVVGLARAAITPVYEMCFYNPGAPPWGTTDGHGAWGADHSPPTAVAAAGDWIVLGWGGAEGGSGVIGVGPDGRKKWGEHQGALVLAGDDQFAYLMLNDFWAGKRGLARLGKADGSYQPFMVDGKLQLPVALETIFGGKPPGEVRGMAAHGGRLVLAMSGGRPAVPASGLAVLDAATAKLLKLLDAKNPGSLAFDQQGKLYALLRGQLHVVDLETGAATAVATPGVGDARAIAVDRGGNIAIADMGADSQVKVFTPAGQLAYTAGKKGGRPLRGAFDPEAMSHVGAIAVDAQGLLWAVENWEYPRRVSVWGKDGSLVRDYIGNTAYSACGTFLHDQNPDLAYAGPVEMKLDRAARRYVVTQVLWVPDRSKGEGFEVTGGLPQPQRFTSNASGQPREYLFNHAWDAATAYTVYMLRGAGPLARWQPVSAICLVGHVTGSIDRGGKVEKEPSGEFAGLNAYDGCFWNDANKDGIAQRSECVIVPARKPAKKGGGGEGPLSLQNGWGGRMGRDLSIYSNGIVRYKPLSFTDDGAPVYGPDGMEKLGVSDHGDLVPLEEENVLLVLSGTGYGETSYVRGLELGTWKELWRYTSYHHGVHGSHHATMPEPGKIIGALKICGAAWINAEVGTVFAIRGNLGEDFLMTADGLYVGALFRDSRMPGPALPEREEDLAGKPVGDLTEGSEPFNGWFGKQADGKVRMLTGIPGQAAMIVEVKGLDGIKRFKGPEVGVDQAALVKAEQANAARIAAQTARKQYAVKRVLKPPAIDGSADDWRNVPAFGISRDGFPEKAQVRLAYDEQSLYLFFEVADESPWRNEGKDYARLFKTGDAVDLQFTVVSSAQPPPLRGAGEESVGPAHLRLLFAPLQGKQVCVLMKPVDKGAPAEKAYEYHSPVGDRHFDRVEILAEAQVAVRVEGQKYRVEAAVPLRAIGLKPTTGMVVRGDAGFISSDAQGTVNVARTYWSNRATNLTNDLPSEAWLYPAAWGEFKFE
ncbi:MAG: hypothetical protein NTW87_35675 [Planctomycetota bacterium]|nr:hypothetical protein [Planctomycetota bacterium]